MFMALSGGLGQLNKVSAAILCYISCCFVHDIENKVLFVSCYAFLGTCTFLDVVL